jgi:hypothetical protein
MAAFHVPTSSVLVHESTAALCTRKFSVQKKDEAQLLWTLGGLLVSYIPLRSLGTMMGEALQFATHCMSTWLTGGHHTHFPQGFEH